MVLWCMIYAIAISAFKHMVITEGDAFADIFITINHHLFIPTFGPSFALGMSNLVTSSFLKRIQSIYPPQSSNKVWRNPWYIVASVAYNASNEPHAIPHIFRHALQSTSTHDERLLLARKTRDALFKSGLNSGYAKTINSLVALDEVMPPELKDKEPLRNRKTYLPEHEAAGQKFFRDLYGDTAGSVQKLLDVVYPEMGWFSTTIGYGLVYGYNEVLTPLETSYMLVGTLIASDTPRQINWHLKGARRLGATREEVKAVRQIAMEVASACGVKWKDGVPELLDEGED
ncbi:hypothetical protein E1B28_012461 [Marasmius oreades]|uniref:Carboxymuconolactone decarboxylase-like domain-containing protein n=1 Tax=Marasmius oreades TaxID=181124 RepID=A0A9P7UN93_9AGAR|nr:uncharacterized protein E1B28_012461 [Marasmius oreades]KAG7088472.1 hypothetical protein E1B28_012461 [Marasmius oreades]